MTELTRVDFTAAELRQLRDVASALLSAPAGVFPGPAVDATARVTASMKLLRADADASHKKFIDFPPLAPFAARVIVEQLAPASAPTPARVPSTRKRMAKAPNGQRQRTTAAARRGRREVDVPLPMGETDDPAATEE